MRFFSSENQAVYFLLRKLKQDNGYIKKEIQDESIPKYYLDFAEYNEGKLDKIAIFFMNLKVIYNRFPCYGAMICFEGRKNYREKKETKVKKPMRDFLDPVSALLILQKF